MDCSATCCREIRPISAVILFSEDDGGSVLEKLQLDLTGVDPVPAYFIKPKELESRAPVVFYNHCHDTQYVPGKNELLQSKPEAGLFSYAEDLNRCSMCALRIDTWVFGERSTRSAGLF